MNAIFFHDGIVSSMLTENNETTVENNFLVFFFFSFLRYPTTTIFRPDQYIYVVPSTSSKCLYATNNKQTTPHQASLNATGCMLVTWYIKTIAAFVGVLWKSYFRHTPHIYFSIYTPSLWPYIL